MADPVMVARRARGKGLRSRKAKLRKAALTAKPATVADVQLREQR
jgi:hypothetical protein